MELIKSNDTKYEEYENLLLERDQARKEAGSIWTCYIQTFGQLITDVYEEKLECVKRKKTIAYYQAVLNKGGVVDPAAMKEFLDREMASYYTHLKRMQDDNARCRDAGTSTNYEVQRAKTLYRRLAKLLHPDINPETDRQVMLKELWQRILTAYGHNDIRALSELEVLTRKALKELGAGEIRVDIPDIDDRIESMKKEIYEIMHTEPYTHGELLNDEDAVSKKKAELEEELESYRKYRAELDEVIKEMEQGGGIRFQWLMK
jgi:hypothetical protein